MPKPWLILLTSISIHEHSVTIVHVIMFDIYYFAAAFHRFYKKYTHSVANLFYDAFVFKSNA